MNWERLRIAPDRSHHVAEDGAPAYSERFDDVLAFHAAGLAAVARDGASWHIRPDGSPAYARRFQRTFGFYEGLAAVSTASGWHHIGADGEDAYADRHSWCGNFQEGLCPVRDSAGCYSHIRTDGAAAYPERWRYAGDYRGGHAVVQGANGLSTHIDAAGRLLHDRWLLDLDVFHKGFARARDGDGWLHIDRSGKPAYGRRFAAVEPFYNGQARVECLDGTREVIDESGACVLQIRPPERSDFAALSADMVGFWRTKAIATAVRLGVIEALPGKSADVANLCGLRVDGALRLLRGLGELKIVQTDGEIWSLTPRGQFLHGAHPLTLADAALEYAGSLSLKWDDLPSALSAESEWLARDIFREVAHDGERCEPHHRMMQSYARHDYVSIPAALDLRGDERIIDAGGGTGALAEFVCDAFSGVSVIILDRPEVVEIASGAAVRNDRIRWQPQDIFAPWRLTADVVILARVLHDWNDAGALRILSQARAALREGGRLIIVEMVASEHNFAGALCDLHLLAATGGQERSESEFADLLRQTKFRVTAVRNVTRLTSVLVGVTA